MHKHGASKHKQHKNHSHADALARTNANKINHNAHCEQTRNVGKIGDAETASLSMNFRPEFPSIAKAQIHRPSNAEAQTIRIPHHPEPIESLYWIHDYSGNIESSGSVVANQRPIHRLWGGTKDTHTNAATEPTPMNKTPVDVKSFQRITVQWKHRMSNTMVEFLEPLSVAGFESYKGITHQWGHDNKIRK